MAKRFLTAVAIFALAAAAGAQKLGVIDARVACGNMASPLLLKLDGIPGDSNDKCHRDEIEVMSFRSAAQSLIITKKIDRSSPLLFMYGLSGRHIEQAVLTVLDTGGQRLMIYKAKNVLIQSLDQVAGSADRETVELLYASMGLETQSSKATAPAPAQAFIDVTLQIPNLGSSAVFTLTDGVASGSGSGSGGGAGKALIRDFVIDKPLDAMSPKLMQAFQAGHHILEINLTLRPRGSSQVLQYKLSDVLVTGDTQQGTSSSQTERVQFKAAKITMEHNSGTRPPVRAGWDVKANTKV
jgi:type VI secretion system secreted protein Hcp